MTVEEFWQKWSPSDWPAVVPSAAAKARFMLDLERVIAARMRQLETAAGDPQRVALLARGEG